MDDQEGYNQQDQYNVEESYESDIQKKFEKELKSMERIRQMQEQNQQEGEDIQQDDEQNINENNEDNGYQDGQDNQNGEEYYQQQQDENEQQQQQYDQENDDQYQNNQENNHNGESNDNEENNEKKEQLNDKFEQQDEDNQEQEQAQHFQSNNKQANANKEQKNKTNNVVKQDIEIERDNEDVDQKVETLYNQDGSITTVTLTKVTKTYRNQNEYSKNKNKEQNKKSNTITQSKQIYQVEKSSNVSESTSIVRNNNELIELVSEQKMTIQTLKAQLKDEKDINIIQALEIDSLKKVVRKLQSNLESLAIQVKEYSNHNSPHKSEYSRVEAPISAQMNQYKEYEKERKKQSEIKILSENEQEEINVKNHSNDKRDSLYLSSFQKSLWIPGKEKYADSQLYGQPSPDQKQKTLRPLKKVSSKKTTSQIIPSNITVKKEEQNGPAEGSETKKKMDMKIFEEEMNKLAKQNKDSFAKIYKQNKLKMQQDLFEDYQKKKQQQTEERENRIKEEINWEESLHQVSRIKSVKNVTQNNDDKSPNKTSKTPSYMQRQLQYLKNELHLNDQQINELKQNSQSVSSIPTIENGYSPNSVSGIAAGNSILKSMKVQSSVQIQNHSQSPLHESYSIQPKKVFSYQISEIDKNYLPKSSLLKQSRITADELNHQKQNLEFIKEKNREDENKKLDEYNKLKISPGYRLTRKSSDELRASAIQSANSTKKPQQQSHPKFRVPYPTLSGLQQQTVNLSQKQEQENKSMANSSILDRIASDKKFNPYSISSNPQKDESRVSINKIQKKEQVNYQPINNSSSTVSKSQGYNPFSMSNQFKQKDYQNENKDKQQKSSSQENIHKYEQGVALSTNSHRNQKDNQRKITILSQNNADQQNQKNKLSYKEQQQLYNNDFDSQTSRQNLDNQNKNQFRNQSDQNPQGNQLKNGLQQNNNNNSNNNNDMSKNKNLNYGGNQQGNQKQVNQNQQAGQQKIKSNEQQNENNRPKQPQNKSNNKNSYDRDPSQLQGISDMEGVKAEFTQFNTNPSNIKENQKQQPEKRVPKVRKQDSMPRKSQFIEQLEKESVEDRKIKISDEKVFLKPIEQDDEPMFGYDSENDEEEEEEEEEQVIEIKKVTSQKRSSLRQSFNHNVPNKRVSIFNTQKNQVFSKDDKEDDQEDEQKFRKTPVTPFYKNKKEVEDDQEEQVGFASQENEEPEDN